MVSSFVQLLERRYTDKLDADAHDFITFAAEGAQRMHALLNDLLTYSRLNVQSQPNARLSTEQMLERVINRLRDSIQETNTVIRYGPLPEITGNAEQFGLLFLHLLDNA
ncbi:TPA: hypothetical protein DDW35_02730, partial [Candidatus Sumerlaeota bacterium]|nr:hypothetical protein [Candidatus Sumerlaeota bacterium]